MKLNTGDEYLDKRVEELPEKEQAQVMIYVEALRNFVKAGGVHALIALAVVGTEEGNKNG